MIFRRASTILSLEGLWNPEDPRTWTCSSGEHAWVYKSKSKAGHSINIQWERRENQSQTLAMLGLEADFLLLLCKFLMGGASSAPFNSPAVFPFPLSKCFPALITFLRARELDIVSALSAIKCTPKRSSKWDFQGRSFGLYCGLFVLQKVRVKKRKTFFYILKHLLICFSQ